MHTAVNEIRRKFVSQPLLHAGSGAHGEPLPDSKGPPHLTGVVKVPLRDALYIALKRVCIQVLGAAQIHGLKNI